MAISVEKKRARDRAWRQRNRKSINARNKVWRENNKEWCAAYRAKYYRENRSKILDIARAYRKRIAKKAAEYQREYRERNKEKLKAKRLARYPEKAEAQKQRRRENAEIIALKAKAYRERNREKIRAYNVRKYWANPEKERARVKANHEARRARVVYGSGPQTAKLGGLLKGKAGALAQLVATEAKRMSKRSNFATVLEDIVQDVLVELLCTPPPKGEEKRQVRRLLWKYSARTVYRASGMSFEESPSLKRSVLGERYEASA